MNTVGKKARRTYEYTNERLNTYIGLFRDVHTTCITIVQCYNDIIERNASAEKRRGRRESRVGDDAWGARTATSCKTYSAMYNLVTPFNL